MSLNLLRSDHLKKTRSIPAPSVRVWMANGDLPKVLLVSDPDSDLEHLLKPLNVRTVYSPSIELALKCLSYERLDLILLDWCAPHISGMVLLTAVQECGYDVPVILLTDHSPKKDGKAFMKMGAFACISKPFDQDVLWTVVRRAISKRRWESKLVFVSDKMVKVYARILKAAGSWANVCIQGKSGTGKELIARMIHRRSPRKNRPLITLDCATLSERSLEGVLSRSDRGEVDSSTVAGPERSFHLADGVTLFLDQITELSLPLQARLLGLIECRELCKLDGRSPIPLDFRIISTTNRDLYRAVDEKKFREDLFYRINVIPVTVPPLRERREDIPVLVYLFLERFAWEHSKPINGVDSWAMDLLMSYDWPGNIRELKNCIERAVVTAEGDTIRTQNLSLPSRRQDDVRVNPSMT